VCKHVCACGRVRAKLVLGPVSGVHALTRFVCFPDEKLLGEGHALQAQLDAEVAWREGGISKGDGGSSRGGGTRDDERG
jgi:hypothetical protein